MGDFRIVIEGGGPHGCQRQIVDGGTVTAKCQDHFCVDCLTRTFVDGIKERGLQVHKAEFIHWPKELESFPGRYDGSTEVRDDLLSGKRTGTGFGVAVAEAVKGFASIRMLLVLVAMALASLMFTSCATLQPKPSAAGGELVTVPAAPAPVVNVVHRVIEQGPKIGHEALTSAASVLPAVAVAVAAPSPVSIFGAVKAFVAGNPTLSEILGGTLVASLVGLVFFIIRKKLKPEQARKAEGVVEGLQKAADGAEKLVEATPSKLDDVLLAIGKEGLAAVYAQLHKIAAGNPAAGVPPNPALLEAIQDAHESVGVPVPALAAS